MIRQRVLVGSSSATGVRLRVVACRKRLRVFRAIDKAQIHSEMSDDGELPNLQSLVAASAETKAVLMEESALVLPLLEGQDAQLT